MKPLVFVFLTIGLVWASEPVITVVGLKGSAAVGDSFVSLSDNLTRALADVKGYRILAWDGALKALGNERGSRMRECGDSKCYAEIGALLHTDFIAAGTVGKIGSKYVLNLMLINVAKSEIARRVSVNADAPAGLSDKIPETVKKLLAPEEKAAAENVVKGDSATPSKKDMVWVPGGSYMMGSEKFGKDEKPVYEMAIDGFYMDKYEVSQEQFEKVMGFNNSRFKNVPDHYQLPVEMVTWEEANDYCKKVGKRLPTEGEWEYACRAGTSTNYYWGDQFSGRYAWGPNNSLRTTHPVGQKEPNRLGLYDMSGNVAEWCSDWWLGYYNDRNKPGRKVKQQECDTTVSGGFVTISCYKPVPGNKINRHVNRGGSFRFDEDYLRSTARPMATSDSCDYIGFRCSCTK